MKKGTLRGALQISLVIFLIIFAYAIIRYNVFKGVGVAHIPLFIFNKAIALSSIVLIALSYAFGPIAKFSRFFAQRIAMRKHFGLLGFGLASVHALISLLLFTPAYYPKFFSDGQLNLVGELSMLFGVVAYFIFSLVALTSFPSKEKDKGNWLRIQRLGYLGLVLILFHVVVMGWEGWWNPSGWPGGLLPISLIAFIVIAMALFLRILMILFGRKHV